MTTATLPGGYTYSQLDILTLTPNVGPVGGGTNCTATGRGLDSVLTTVTLGNVAVDNLVIVSDTEITFDAPANTAGVVDLVVTQDTVYDILPNCFTYTAYKPSVVSITPGTGSEAGNTEITVTGANFDNTSTVTIDGNLCTDIVVVSDTEITCVTPAGTIGQQDVVVTNSIGDYTIVNGFIYYSSALLLIGTSPISSLVDGGDYISASGLNFDNSTVIKIGGMPLINPSFVDDSTITGIIPSGISGTEDVTAEKGIETSTLLDYFTYVTPLTLTSISPNSGLPSGGQTVTIIGSGIGTNAVVTIDDVPLINQVVVNDTTITGEIPPSSTGPKNVVLYQSTAVGVLSATLADGFIYSAEGYLGTQQIKNTFQQLLYVEGGITDELKPVQDAKGMYTPIQISKDKVKIFNFEFTNDSVTSI